MLKHIGTIPLDDKKFAIYVDENFHKYFFLMDLLGGLISPNRKDLDFLRKIYNETPSDIVKKEKNQRKEEKSSKNSLVFPIISGLCLAFLLFPSKQIKNKDDLTKILGYESVSPSQIYEAIDNNHHLSKEEKVLVKELTTELIEEYPDLDYRIYYENMKNFDINSMTKEEMEKKFDSDYISGMTLKGYFKTQIDYIEGSRETLKHELGHLLNNYLNFFKKAVKYDTTSIALEEAMNANMTDKESYPIERTFLDFCLKNIDFDATKLTETGIYYLVDQLREKYSSVDITKIITFLNEKTLSHEGYFYIDENQDILDEIFKMCLVNYSKEEKDPYKAFNEFSELLVYAKDKELLYEYLEKYNQFLIKQGVENIRSVEEVRSAFNKFKDVCAFQNHHGFWIQPYIYRDGIFEAIDYNGETKSFIFQETNLEFTNYQNQILLSSVKDFETMGTESYWRDFVVNNEVFPYAKVKEVDIYYKNKYLTNAYLKDINFAICMNDKNEFGIIIYYFDEVIYQSIDHPTAITTPYPLFFDIDEFAIDQTATTIDLSSILTKDYIKRIANDHFFNLIFKDGNWTIEPLYKLYIDDSLYDEKFVDYIGHYKLYPDNDPLLPPNEGICIKDSRGDIWIQHLKIDEPICLEDILKHYDILDEKKLEYHFTIKELEDLIISYINELHLKDFTRTLLK